MCWTGLEESPPFRFLLDIFQDRLSPWWGSYTTCIRKRKFLSCQKVSHRTIPSAELKQLNPCFLLQWCELKFSSWSSIQVKYVLCCFTSVPEMVPWGHSNMEIAVVNTVLLGTSTIQAILHSKSLLHLNKGHLYATYDPPLDPVWICTEKEINGAQY